MGEWGWRCVCEGGAGGGRGRRVVGGEMGVGESWRGVELEWRVIGEGCDWCS